MRIKIPRKPLATLALLGSLVGGCNQSQIRDLEDRVTRLEEKVYANEPIGLDFDLVQGNKVNIQWTYRKGSETRNDSTSYEFSKPIEETSLALIDDFWVPILQQKSPYKIIKEKGDFNGDGLTGDVAIYNGIHLEIYLQTSKLYSEGYYVYNRFRIF